MSGFIKKSLAYYAGARERAGRRASRWNALLIPLSLGAWAGIWYFGFKLVWLFHTVFYPDHLLKDFWRQGVSLRSGLFSFLMVFSLGPGAVSLGFILTNLILWLIPGARKAFESEAAGHPGTNFRETMHTLFKFFIWTSIPGILSALLAAYYLTSLE